MKVQELTLQNFRNIDVFSMSVDPGINFLLGPNGQGKTSLLEAVSFLSSLRSFRGAKTEEVIRWGQEQAEIRCTLGSNDTINPWKTELKVSFSAPGGEKSRGSKTGFVNQKAIKSAVHYLKQRGFHAIVFNPSDHALVQEDPATRRVYLDRVIAAEDPSYFSFIQKYQKVLNQRNALLKQEAPFSQEHLLGFTETLCGYAVLITHKRLLWIQKLSQRISHALRRIAPKQLELNVKYISNWVPKNQEKGKYNSKLNLIHFSLQEAPPSLEMLETAFWTQFSLLQKAELKARVTLVGPHRDDWVLFLGNQMLKGHGSQGEVRSALLALKLSEIELFREETGSLPVFLLDDFSSELDQERRHFLLKFLLETDLQVFVTSTEDSFQSGKKFWILREAQT